LRETTDSIMRIVLASAAVAGVSFGIWYGLDQALGRSFLGQLASVGIALTLGVGVYLVSCRALQVRELGALLALRRRLKSDST
jgi:hypothetical protein